MYCRVFFPGLRYVVSHYCPNVFMPEIRRWMLNVNLGGLLWQIFSVVCQFWLIIRQDPVALAFVSICSSCSACVELMWTCMNASSAPIQLPLLTLFSHRGFLRPSCTHATRRTSSPVGFWVMLQSTWKPSIWLGVWMKAWEAVEWVIMFHINKSLEFFFFFFAAMLRYMFYRYWRFHVFCFIYFRCSVLSAHLFFFLKVNKVELWGVNDIKWGSIIMNINRMSMTLVDYSNKQMWLFLGSVIYAPSYIE